MGSRGAYSPHSCSYANYEPSEPFIHLCVGPHFTTTITGCREVLDKQLMVFILLFSTFVSAWCPLSDPGCSVKSA